MWRGGWLAVLNRLREAPHARCTVVRNPGTTSWTRGDKVCLNPLTRGCVGQRHPVELIRASWATFPHHDARVSPAHLAWRPPPPATTATRPGYYDCDALYLSLSRTFSGGCNPPPSSVPLPFSVALDRSGSPPLHPATVAAPRSLRWLRWWLPTSPGRPAECGKRFSTFLLPMDTSWSSPPQWYVGRVVLAGWIIAGRPGIRRHCVQACRRVSWRHLGYEPGLLTSCSCSTLFVFACCVWYSGTRPLLLAVAFFDSTYRCLMTTRRCCLPTRG